MSLKLTRPLGVTPGFALPGIAHAIVTVVPRVIVVTVHIVVMVTIAVFGDIAVTAAVAVAAVPRAPVTLTSWVGVDLDLLNVYFLAAYCLLRRFQELVDDVPRFESDEAEALALVLRLVEGGLDFYDGAVLAEVCFNVVVCDLGGQAADEDLALLGLLAHSFWVHLGDKTCGISLSHFFLQLSNMSPFICQVKDNCI